MLDFIVDEMSLLLLKKLGEVWDIPLWQKGTAEVALPGLQRDHYCSTGQEATGKEKKRLTENAFGYSSPCRPIMSSRIRIRAIVMPILMKGVVTRLVCDDGHDWHLCLLKTVYGGNG